MQRRLRGVLTGWLVVAGVSVAAAQPTDTLKTPTMGAVTTYRPAGAVQQVVLFVSGDGGWNQGVVDMATRLRDLGALVVGIDIRTFRKNLESASACAYPAAALEELSRAIQLQYALPKYLRPVLVGYSSGATLVYAAIVAAPPETFAGAISLGFCPDIELQRPLCQMRGLHSRKRAKGTGADLSPFAASTVPWMVLQGTVDQVCDPAATRAFVSQTGAARVFELPQVGHGFGVPARWAPQFVQAYRAIAASRESAPAVSTTDPPVVQDLSLVEVPATASAERDAFAVLLSGDGGWADIDKQVARGLSAAGVPVVGWSSLDYYWTPRSPGGAAADLARLIDHYTATWKKSQVLIVGYSFGADVAPYLVNGLPDRLRARIARVALLGPSPTAAFAFHVSSWLGGGGDRRYPTAPEIERLSMPVACVAGEDEPDSVCHAVRNPRVRGVAIGRGHHFSGEYDRIVSTLVP